MAVVFPLKVSPTRRVASGQRPRLPPPPPTPEDRDFVRAATFSAAACGKLERPEAFSKESMSFNKDCCSRGGFTYAMTNKSDVILFKTKTHEKKG